MPVMRIAVKTQSHKLRRDWHGAVTLHRQWDQFQQPGTRSCTTSRYLFICSGNCNTEEQASGSYLLDQNYAVRISYHGIIVSSRGYRQAAGAPTAHSSFLSATAPGPAVRTSQCLTASISTCRHVFENIMQGHGIPLDIIHMSFIHDDGPSFATQNIPLPLISFRRPFLSWGG
jgi:hypothetical protein